MHVYIVCGCRATDDDASDSSPHHKHSSCLHTTEDVSDTKQRTRRQRRNQVARKRRRILQPIDSSTEDDLDVSNNNKIALAADSKHVIPQSDQKESSPYSNSHRLNAHLSEFTESGRPSSVVSGQRDLAKRSAPSMQPADCIGSGRTGLTGSRQSNSISRSDLSIQSEGSRPAEVTETLTEFQSMKSVHNIGASDATKVSKSLVANDVPTFSLAFDDFLASDDDDIDDQVTEYTRLKAPNGGIFASEKPDDDSLDVVNSVQAAETCRPVCVTVSAKPGLTGSGRPSLTGSGQPSSELGLKTTMSTMSSSILPQIDCTARPGWCELTRLQRPSAVAGSGRCELTGSQSEAERSREERIRLSRLKKEEFQRKFANTLCSDQSQTSSSSVDTSKAKDHPQTSSSSVGTSNAMDHPQTRSSSVDTSKIKDHPQTRSASVDTSSANDMDDHQQTQLRVLVDSRELSSAQVSYMYYQWPCNVSG